MGFITLMLFVPVVVAQKDVLKFVESNSEREGYISLKTSGIWIDVCEANQAAVDSFCRWSGFQVGIRDSTKNNFGSNVSGWKFDVICEKNAKSISNCKLISCTANSRLYVRCSGYPSCTLENGVSLVGNSSRVVDNRKLCHCGKGGVITCKCIQRTCSDGNIGNFDGECNLICKEATNTAIVSVNAECHDKLNLGYCVSQKHKCQYVPIQRQCSKTCGTCGQLEHCRDTYDTEICLAWKRKDGCGKESVKKVCRKSCGVCQVEGATQEVPANECEDKYKGKTCKIFYDNGQCETSPPIQRWCAKTCGLCTSKEDLEIEGDCTNELGERLCKFSSSRGSCSYNLKILEGCRRSCGLCDKLTIENCRDLYDTDNCRIWKTNGQCADDVKVQRYCAETCGVCESLQTVEPPVEEGNDNSELIQCEDTAHASLCEFYRTRGFCEKAAYKSLVEERCPKTCGMCGEECSDKISTSTCQKWRQYGSCENNTSVREKLCSKTCNFCS